MKIQAVGVGASTAKPHGAGRALVAMLLGGSSALLGCASMDPVAWQVQPLLRSGASSSAVMRDGYTSLARRYDYEGRWLQAAQAWEKAAQAEPSNPALHTALGVALAHAGRSVDAVASLRRAVGLSPGSAQSLNNLGYALWLAGQPAEAVQVLKAALAIAPAHRAALANLTLADPSQAAATADQALPVPAEAVAAAPGADGALAVLAVQILPNLAAFGMAGTSRQAGAAAAFEVASKAAERVAVGTAPARITIVNGMGVPGAASKLRALLTAQGLPWAMVHNLPPYQQATTVIQYRAGFAAAARQVAAHVPGGAAVSEALLEGRAEDLRVVLGRDRKTALALCLAMNHCAGPGPAGHHVLAL